MRQRPVLAVLTAVLACSGAAACAGEEVEEEAVTIGVAAAPSLSAAFTEIISVFEADNPGVRVSIELGKSGEIAKSLGSRSDINVFASASEEAMQRVVAEGAAVDPRVFARNHVVLAVPSGNPKDVSGLEDLDREGLRVGLCDVEVPCGQAADTLLTAAGEDPVDVERIAGSRALAAQLADNDADVGIIYRTDVASSHGWVEEVDVDPRDRELQQASGTTSYVLARVPGGEDGPSSEAKAAASDRFVELVLSSRGRSALLNSGLEAVSG